MVDVSASPFPASPVAPTLYDGDHVIKFRCHKDVGCFNACCKSIDITLTPYDIVRLKQRLSLSSSEFLLKYTVPFEFEKDGLAGVKFKPVDKGTACQFMTDEGCSVYEDRPTACRYYPVGLVALRKEGESVDKNSFALVKEEHCLGHHEDRELTIDQYRKEQGVDQYDELDRGWRQLILKKKSSGPSIGKPSKRSLQLFFMACYDLDRFRQFVSSEAFQSSFEVDAATQEKIAADDTELMLFSFRFLKQVLFGEESVPLKDNAREAWEARRRAAMAVQQTSLNERAPYDPSVEPVEAS